MVNRLDRYWPTPYPPAYSDQELELHAIRSAAIEVLLLVQNHRLSASQVEQVETIAAQLAVLVERLRTE